MASDRGLDDSGAYSGRFLPESPLKHSGTNVGLKPAWKGLAILQYSQNPYKGHSCTRPSVDGEDEPAHRRRTRFSKNPRWLTLVDADDILYRT